MLAFSMAKQHSFSYAACCRSSRRWGSNKFFPILSPRMGDLGIVLMSHFENSERSYPVISLEIQSNALFVMHVTYYLCLLFYHDCLCDSIVLEKFLSVFSMKVEIVMKNSNRFRTSSQASQKSFRATCRHCASAQVGARHECCRQEH